LRLARFDEENGHLSRAKVSYARALAGNPWSVFTLNRYGMLLAREGKKREARAMLLRSLQVKPNQIDIRRLVDSLGS